MRLISSSAIRISLLLIFSLSFIRLSAQTEQNEIQRLLNLSRQNSRYPDSLKIYGKKLLQFNDSLAKVEGHFALGYSFYQKGQLAPASLHYDSALIFTNSEKTYSTYSRIKRNKAIVYQRLGDYENSKGIYEDLLNHALATNNPQEEALMLNQLGLLYQSSGNYQKSAESLNKAVEIYRKVSPENLTNTLLNLGTLYGRMNLLEQSNKILLEAAANAANYQQDVLVARCYNNIAVNHRKASALDSANYYLDFCEKVYLKTNNTLGLIQTYQNKANNFLDLKEKDSTYFYMDKCLTLNQGSQDLFREKELDFLHAQYELTFGEAEKAIYFINESITKALKQNRIDDLEDSYVLLSQAYEKEGDAEAALAVMRKWKSLNDSLEIYKNLKTIQEITSAYDFARSKQMIQESKAQTSFFQKLSVKLGVGITALIIILLLVFYRFRKVSREANLNKNEINDLNTKISKLQKLLEQSSSQFITLKSKAALPLNKLMFVQSDGPYLEFHLEERPRPEIDRGTLKDLNTELPKASFIQIHRSYIVNMHFIREVYANKLVLQNGQELNISKSFKKTINEVFHSKAS